jgi:hypothetical protein
MGRQMTSSRMAQTRVVQSVTPRLLRLYGSEKKKP